MTLGLEGSEINKDLRKIVTWFADSVTKTEVKWLIGILACYLCVPCVATDPKTSYSFC